MKITLNSFITFGETGHGLQKIEVLSGDSGKPNHFGKYTGNLPDGNYLEVCKCHPIENRTNIQGRIVEISNGNMSISYELDITICPDFDKEKESIGKYLYNFGK